jgi:predicted dehydrogenase
MEAFMDRCHPQTHLLRQLLDNRAIGDVRIIHASFGYAPATTGIRDVNAGLQSRDDVDGTPQRTTQSRL